MALRANKVQLLFLLIWILNIISLVNTIVDGFENRAQTRRFRRLQQSSSEEEVIRNRTEWNALFGLRASLGLRSKEWPKKVNPCTNWRGIECEGGHVVAINVSGFRRTVVGSRNPQFSVDALQNLTFLQIFNASRFTLLGTIPQWFYRLTSLTVLDLTSCFVSGTLPSSLGKLSKMTTLALSKNNISGSIPVSFGQLANLRTLNLSSNNLSGSLPNSLFNLVNLTRLDLSENKLQGTIPSSISSLSRLTVLKLGKNSITGSVPSQLGNLAMLNELDLGFNNFSGVIPKELGNLTNLANLVLEGNSLSGLIPSEIIKCVQLQTLVLENNNLSGALPKSMGSLTKLRILNLSYNNLTGSLPESISGLSSITNANFSHNLFYNEIPPRLSAQPSLLSLDLSNNFFEGKLRGGFAAGTLLEERNCLQGATQQRSYQECSKFYQSVGLSFTGFGNTSPAPSPATSSVSGSGKKSKHLAAILGGIFGGLGLVLVVIVLVYLFQKHERKVAHTDKDVKTPPARRGSQSAVGISVNLSSLGEAFTYEQLLRATGEFSPSNIIKNGHSGTLYLGTLEGGLQVVVKRVETSTSKRDYFASELDVLGRASHTRMVPLLGHCLAQEEEKFLVYKYMPYRDLSNALYKRASPPNDTLQSLDWITRLKIATGAAEGLTYLHHECSPPIVHRDVQASSILLDDKYEVRLGSLSEACPQEGEAHQSVISRFLRRSHTSDQGASGSPAAHCSYDVYCFGKVLLELISGKLGISGSVDPSANQWLDSVLPLINIHEKESMANIIDPSLMVDEDLMEEVWAMAIVAKSCLNPKASKRPLMRYILKALENPLKVVREDPANTSARLRTSSRGSWNAAVFGSSWRHSSSEIAAVPVPIREEYLQKNNLRRTGTSGSQGSGQGGDSSQKRLSNEIFPEPTEEAIIQESSSN